MSHICVLLYQTRFLEISGNTNGVQRNPDRISMGHFQKRNSCKLVNVFDKILVQYD